MTVTGECFCGRVKYEVDGDLRNARSCHCSRCRKAFSGAGSTFAEIDADQFLWTSGEESLTVYVTSPEWGLCFCSICGSTLGGMHNDKMYGITLGTLNGDPDVKLGRLIFVGSKASWDEIGGDAPRFEEWPP